MDRVTDILNVWFDDPHRPNSKYGQLCSPRRGLTPALPRVRVSLRLCLSPPAGDSAIWAFPHRNQVLGRTTTPAEAEFLKLPSCRF